MIPKVYDRWLARQSVVSWIYVFVGSVVLSAGFVLFMNPYRIVPGGVYGAGIVLHYLFPSVQVGTFGLMLDIPLLLVGMKVFGRAFGAKTIFSALLIPLSMNAMTWLFGESPETLFGGAMNLSQDMFLPCIFGGVLIGATISAIMLAIYTGNAGGAWDNAKKFIESGGVKGAMKGDETHEAAVVGDTVGDPLKDTVGPSLDILIKIMSTVSLILVSIFSKYNVLDWILSLFK